MNQTKLPIFIVCGKSPIGASGGGYSAYAYNLSKILKSQGYPVFIVALGQKNESVQTPVGQLLLFKASFFNFNITALPGLPFFSWVFANGIEKIMQMHGYKKTIIWGIGPWGLAGTLLRRRLGKKIIFLNNYFTTTKHEWSGGLRAMRFQDYGLVLKLKYLLIYSTVVQYLSALEKQVLDHADVIITNYRSTEQILEDEFKVSPKKFYRAHFSVEVYSRQVASQNKLLKLPKRYIFYISRHDPRKGINFLIRAYGELVKRGLKVPLLIGGTGDLFEANQRLSKRLGLEHQIKFLGFVNNPKPLIQKCAAFAFPSLEEGAGALTVNEAMSLGAPIVSTACDGIVEDITDHKTGLLVDMANPAALADGIEELLNNPKQAKLYGQSARRKYLQSFSFTKMSADLAKLLRRFN